MDLREVEWKVLSALMASTLGVNKARNYIEEMGFFTHDDFHHVWEILRNYVQRYRTLPSKDVYEFELSERQQGNSALMETMDVNSLVTHIGYVLDRNPPGIDYINYCVGIVFHRYQDWAKERIAEAAHLNDMTSVERLHRKATSAKVTEEELEQDAFIDNDPDQFMQAGLRQGIGVPPVDDLSNGGLKPGESALFIMPTGVGKTTLGIQMCEACVNNELNIMYHSLEQPLQDDMAMRQYVRATDSGRTYWEYNKPSDLFEKEPWIKKNWDENRDNWVNYLRFYGGWANPDVYMKSVYDLFAPLYRLKEEQGILIQYMVVDWWGEVVRKLAQGNDLTDDGSIKQYEKWWASDIADYTSQANEDGIPVRTVVLHQVAGKTAEANVGQPVTIQSSAGNKDLANKFAWGAASSKKDNRNIFSMNQDKTRGAKGGVQYYKLDGERCLIVRPTAEECSEMSEEKTDAGRKGRKRR